MLGAITGDITGSAYEAHPVKSKNIELFPDHARFTDDTVLTIAVADAILSGSSYREKILEWGRKYPNAGYGGMFIQYLSSSNPRPYNSFGNGSAMRVSPIGWAFDSEKEVLDQTRRSAEITHNHTEGIKGAQAVALAVFLARKGSSKEDIRTKVRQDFGYDLERNTDSIRPGYSFDVTCQGSVPEAIIAFLDSTDFEDALRNAISLGGDADTQAAITGGIAEAFYGGIPEEMKVKVMGYLDEEMVGIVRRFSSRR